MNSAVPNQTSTKVETPTKMSTETSIEAPVPNPAPQPNASQTLMPWNRPTRKLSPAERREAKEKDRIKRRLLEKIVTHRLGLRDQVFTRGLRAIVNRNLNALASEMIADASKKSKYITTRGNKKS
jgi:hypothetical protein